jgi:hypothetical protein
MATGISSPDDHYGVLLPCTPETFADFVAGLLGAPQTIERRLFNPFELDLAGVESLYHLLDQRVKQQNQASLLQFTAKIYFSDSSSVLLASLKDLLHYNEVRSVVSNGVHLTWAYLIQFPDRQAPEKQQIDVTFRALPDEEDVSDDFAVLRPMVVIRTATIVVRIAHTARSWGVDIESLLTNHLQSLLVDESPLRRSAAKHSGKATLAVFLLSFLSIFGGMFVTERSQDQERARATIQALKGDIGERVDYVIRVISASEGLEGSATGLLTVGAFVLASILAGVTFSMCDTRPPSFVLLTKPAETRRAKVLRKRQRSWFWLLGTVFLAIVAGVIGNWVYALIALS